MVNENFAIFIMVHGRPQKNWTLETLNRCGYTGKVYMVADTSDMTLPMYQERYGEDLCVFDKSIEALNYDAGDNSGDLRSTMYSANTIFRLAEEKGIEFFSIMCDDYLSFEFRYISDNGQKLLVKKITDIDFVLNKYLEFYKSTNFKTIAFAQGGDFIGGVQNPYVINRPLMRKAMNSFICSTKRKFEFMGRLNEDVTTYVNLGHKGDLFGTIPMISIIQKPTQQEKKGLSDVYKDNGTYIKSFFSVMFNPSSVKVAMLNSENKRIHHVINWENAVPKIISQKHKR